MIEQNDTKKTVVIKRTISQVIFNNKVALT